MTTTDTTDTTARPPEHRDREDGGDRETTRIRVPGLGTVELARPELVFVGGIAAMAALGVLEWPIALVLGAGHLLAADRSNRAARQLGYAMEEAG